MRLTIIPSDSAVYKDNEAFLNLDLSAVPSGVHALQWYDTHGWIEYTEFGSSKPPNEDITALPDWAETALAKWQEAKAAHTAMFSPSPDQPSVDGAQTF